MGNNGKKATRIHRVTVRFNEQEYKLLQDKVSHTTHTPVEFIRRAVTGKRLQTPSVKTYGDDMEKIFSELAKIKGWTKNFYNETGGMQADLTRQILFAINGAAKKILRHLEELRANNKQERQEDERAY